MTRVAGTHLAAHRFEVFEALGHRFTVACSSRPLLAYLEDLFAAFVTPRGGRGSEPVRPTQADVTQYTLAARREDDAWDLTVDGEPLVRAGEAAEAVAMLLWDVNRRVVERTEGMLLLHAAAAERDGLGVVLPGAMEAGKTTLVAALVRDGMRYLSDEVAAVEPSGRWMRPYAKALSVDPGSWPLLSELEPVVDERVRAYLPAQWQVVPNSIHADAISPGAAPRLVVVLRYEPGASTQARPLAGADALASVTQCAFRLHDDPAFTLDALTRLLETCACYELVHSDLASSVRVVHQLLDRVGAQQRGNTPLGSIRSTPPEGGQCKFPVRSDALGRGAQAMTRTIRPDEIDLEFAPRRCGSVMGVELDGEMMLYAVQGTVHKLDALASVLWNCFDGAVSLAELVEDLDSVYEDVDMDRIATDLLACVRELGRQGLLENVSPEVQPVGVRRATPSPGAGGIGRS